MTPAYRYGRPTPEQVRVIRERRERRIEAEESRIAYAFYELQQRRKREQEATENRAADPELLGSGA